MLVMVGLVYGVPLGLLLAALVVWLSPLPVLLAMAIGWLIVSGTLAAVAELAARRGDGR